jgi:dTDP-4-dehydrorhamnose 3,5-epimerase-like enzyme
MSQLNVQNTQITGVYLLESGSDFSVTGQSQTVFHAAHAASFGLKTQFCADILHKAPKGSVRGLYYFNNFQTAQTINLIRGEVQIVVLDIRQGTRGFGQHEIIHLREGVGATQLYIPAGVAFGVAVMSEQADWLQKLTHFPDTHSMGGIYWRDADLGIAWPFQRPLQDPAESAFPLLRDIAASLPQKVRMPVVL